jgi:hypothetical protein
MSEKSGQLLKQNQQVNESGKKKNGGKKSGGSRLNLFYILAVLAKHSDRENPLTASEINRFIMDDFGLNMSNDTIKRTLDDLILEVMRENIDPKDLKDRYGFFVGAVYSEQKEQEREDEESDYDNQGKRRFFYESAFTVAELLMLEGAIETYSYLEQEDITDITTKLTHMRPVSFDWHDIKKKKKKKGTADEETSDVSHVMTNIRELNDIIKSKKSAWIEYCDYGPNGTLKPRKGYPKEVGPVRLIWGNGYYYLQAYHYGYKHIVNFRIDRITEIKEGEQNVDPDWKTALSASSEYRHKHPVMFSEEPEWIELLCRDTGKNAILNTITDLFGKDVRVRKAGENYINAHLPHDKAYYEQKENMKADWLIVEFNAAPSGVELFAQEYCMDCVLVGPIKSRDRVRERLAKGMAYYR